MFSFGFSQSHFFPLGKRRKKETSEISRVESLKFCLTCESKGSKINTGKFLHFCDFVAPLLVFLSHSWLEKYPTESEVTKYVTIRANLNKISRLKVEEVLEDHDLRTQNLYSCILRFIPVLIQTYNFFIGLDAKNIFCHVKPNHQGTENEFS